MKKVQKKAYSTESKHTHAWDDYGNYVSKEFAINDKRNYYFDKQKQVKLILKTSKLGNLFWSALPNQKIKLRDGLEYNFSDLENKINESEEHRRFKGSIINNQSFYYKQNKVLLKDAQEELTISNTLLRADVYGYLLDDTPCIIEVIKTSDLSLNKENYINKNQILTFKIYIDEYGNQKPEYDNIIGNRDIEEIKNSILNGEGKISEIREYNRRARKSTKIKFEERIQYFREELVRKKEFIINEIERIDKECRQINFGSDQETKEVEIRNKGIKFEIRECELSIERIESEINSEERTFNDIQKQISILEGSKNEYDKEVANTKSRIIAIKTRIREMENTFIEACKRCRIEWYAPKGYYDKRKATLSDFKYWNE